MPDDVPTYKKPRIYYPEINEWGWLLEEIDERIVKIELISGDQFEIDRQKIQITDSENEFENVLALNRFSEEREKELAETRKKNKSVISQSKKKTYDRPQKGKHKSHDVGDLLARALRNKPIDEIYVIASEILNTDETELRNKYSHLNHGMQRMNLGNRIRKILKTGNAKEVLSQYVDINPQA